MPNTNSGVAQRCFQGINDLSNRSSSDYLREKRQKTLFKNMRASAQSGNYLQKKGKNKHGQEDGTGVAYNNTVGIKPIQCGDKYIGELAATDSYATLFDMGKGKHLVNPNMEGAESAKFGSWLSQMIGINYLGTQNKGRYELRKHSGTHKVSPVTGLYTGQTTATGTPGLQIADNSLNNCITFPIPVDQKMSETHTFGDHQPWNPSAYPGYHINPKLSEGGHCNIFKNKAHWWTRFAVPTFTDQPPYWRAVNAQPLNGFAKGPATSWARVNFNDNTVNPKDNIEIQAFGPGMLPGSGPHNCLPDNVSSSGPYSNIMIGWYNNAFKTSNPKKYRVPGFQNVCAYHAACDGMSKVN